MDKKILGLIIIIVAIAAFGIVKNNMPVNTTGNIAIENADSTVKIDLSAVTNEARFFSEVINGVEVKYFAVRASDGSIKTAFNACDVCYREKKGYHQEGDDMVCNNCGLHFAIDSLGTKLGQGCWPTTLANKIEEDQLIISIEDLKAQKYKFA